MKVPLARTIVCPREVTPKTLEIAFEQWTADRSRYETLYRYFVGDHDFSDIHEGQNKVVSNFCQYIPRVMVGYQVGNAPRYSTSEEDIPGQEILELYAKQDKWSVEVQLAEDLSVYGKAFELVYMPIDKDEPNSVVVSPRDAFVAYTGDIERDSVIGVVVYSYKDDDRRTIYRLYVYDQQNVSVWQSLNRDSSPRTWQMVEDFRPHGFGRVPLIEYKNDRHCMGDFESIMDLQDAYNSLLSDRQDNQDSFAQAMLVLSGAVIGRTASELEDSKETLKKGKVLQLDDDATASYLVKTSDESGVQIVQDQYASDIHKFAMVPDLSDEQFSGNASGVAMAYKLFGTDQVVSRKQSQMQKGFTRRCKLYDYRMHNPAMMPIYEPISDIDSMTITFNLNSPQDLSYIATAVSQLTASGVMSKMTARELISAIPDPIEEAERVGDESKATMEMTRDTYGDDPIERMRRQEDMVKGEVEDADSTDSKD